MTTDPPPEPGRPSGPSGPSEPSGPLDDERAELRRLIRAEVARADAEASAGRQPQRPPRHRIRSACSALLIVVACVLAPLSVASVWLASIAGDTNRYVATVAPLAASPAVQDAVAARAATAVTQYVDLNDLLQQLAPAERPLAGTALKALGGPLNDALGNLVQTQTRNVVSSQWFQSFWSEANRRIHSTVVKALTGQGGGAVKLTDDSVVIDLAPVIDQVKQRLVGAGISVAAKIPEVHTQITVLDSQNIGKARIWFRLLQLVGDWLPVIAVVLAAAGVLLAGRRRRALVAASLGVAAATLVLGLALVVFRSVYLADLPASVSQAAAGDVYDTLIRFLRVAVRTVVVLGIAVALGAWLSGPGRRAGQARAIWSSGLAATRTAAGRAGLRTGPVGPWVHRSRHWLVWLLVLGAALALALWSYPTPWVVVGLALGLLFALAVVEFLDEPGADAVDDPDGGPHDTPGGGPGTGRGHSDRLPGPDPSR
jgi:hypothetical protein